jgi:hypothetical protein
MTKVVETRHCSGLKRGAVPALSVETRDRPTPKDRAVPVRTRAERSAPVKVVETRQRLSSGHRAVRVRRFV